MDVTGALFPALKTQVPGPFWDNSLSWVNASYQFSYFSNPLNGYINGQVIDVHNPNRSSGQGGINIDYPELSHQLGSLNVQPGDIMYFGMTGDGADSSDHCTHWKDVVQCPDIP